MTNPPDPQLAALQQTMTALSETVRDLTRAIQGDAATGSLSLRAAIDRLRDDLKKDISNLNSELDSETTALNQRVEALELKQRDQDTALRVYTNIVKFLGGTSLAGVLTLIGWLLKGGHP